MGYREIKRKTITPKQRQEILKRDDNICGYCREPRRRKPSSLVIDHIISVKDGGLHGPENWVSACRSCNRMKWLHSPNEEGAPRLRWFSGRSVAKVTTMGVRYRKRVPIISFKHR
jgi:5-methylcytosine-specific restriction endonuclease McrA